MPNKEILCPMYKAEEQPDGSCVVYSRAAAEELDKAKEILDYATAVPQFEKWRDDTLQRSQGASLGNIRAMHGKVAAGKATQITFLPAEKAIDVVAHIVDPVEAKKCLTRTYTGMSIGGSYLKRWPDIVVKGATRYTPEITEISLVDSPAIASAMFQLVKLDGTVEMVKVVGSGLETPPTFSTRRTSKLEKPPVAVKSFSVKVDSGKCPKCDEPMKDGKCLKCDKATDTGDLSKGVKYLVTEDDGTTHLPYTDESGKPDHAHMGAAHAALHGGYRGNKYEGPKKQEAKDKLKSLYESEKLDLPSEKWNGEGDLNKFDPAQPRDPAAHFAPSTTDDGNPHHGNVMRGQAAKAKASGDEMGAASLKATAASHDAYVEQTADTHDKAAKAHADAAQVHRDGGNPVQGVIHDLHAAHHGNEANKLRTAEPVPVSGPPPMGAGSPVDATFSARKAAGEGDLEKGGPGSGPHPGSGRRITPEDRKDYRDSAKEAAKATTAAKVTSERARGSFGTGAHNAAREAHEEASSAHMLAANDARSLGDHEKSLDHLKQSNYHDSRASYHTGKVSDAQLTQTLGSGKGVEPGDLSKDAAGISTGTGLAFYDQDSTPGAEYKVKQCECGGTLVDGICTACRKVVDKVSPNGDLGKDYLTSTFPHALAKRRSAPIDQRLQKSLWDVTALADQLTRLAKLEGDVAPDAGAVTALRKVFLDLAAEEAAGQIADSTNAGARERFANGLSKGGPGSGPHPGGSAKESSKSAQAASEHASAVMAENPGSKESVKAHQDAAIAHQAAITAHMQEQSKDGVGSHYKEIKAHGASYREHERLAGVMQNMPARKVVSTASLLKEFEVAGFSAKQ
jgi:hypothetical protein